MIESKQDYRFYLEADWFSLQRPRKKLLQVIDPIWKYQRLLRKLEYYQNCKRSIWHGPYRRYLRRRWRRLGLRLGFSLAANSFGPGLCLPHVGTIVVNHQAQVGANCRLHTCVNIGCAAGAPEAAPQIGDNVYIDATR